MGGPMSANSDEGFPSRKAELALLADAVERAVPTIGVCLGAQLLALATGGAVHRGETGAEIGWGPVNLEPACKGDPLFDGVPASLTVMHWHGETYDMPAGAEHLLSNGRYANQGFRTGPAAWGVQFHLEVTEAAVDGLLDAFPQDAEEADGGATAIRSASPDVLAELAPWSGVVFTRFATLVLERSQQTDLVDLR
jgi:GMP synthase-like glutamine amidotransferase